MNDSLPKSAEPALSGGYFYVSCRISNRMRDLNDAERGEVVSHMRRLSRFCAVDVLTHCVMDVRMQMLLWVPDREVYIRRFKNQEGDVAGAGDDRFFDHLSYRYKQSRIEELRQALADLRASGGDEAYFINKYTQRIGNPQLNTRGIVKRYAIW